MATARPPLHERANSYLFLTAGLGAIGVLPYLIGQAEVTDHHPWSNGWVRLAAVIWVLAVMALLWACFLYGIHTWQAHRQRVDERQQEKYRRDLKATQAEKRALDNRIAGLMAKNEERRREHAATHWTPHDAWVGTFTQRGKPEPARAFGIRAPTAQDPMQFHETMATCEVWRGAHVWCLSEPTAYRYNFGYSAAFPQQFDPPPQTVPEWWLDLRSEYRVVWRDPVGEVLSDERVTVGRMAPWS